MRPKTKYLVQIFQVWGKAQHCCVKIGRLSARQFVPWDLLECVTRNGATIYSLNSSEAIIRNTNTYKHCKTWHNKTLCIFQMAYRAALTVTWYFTTFWLSSGLHLPLMDQGILLPFHPVRQEMVWVTDYSPESSSWFPLNPLFELEPLILNLAGHSNTTTVMLGSS